MFQFMKASSESTKKAYSTPTLSKYGDLAAMTSSTGMKGSLDGASMGGNMKTG
jgi:hypothetical protein